MHHQSPSKEGTKIQKIHKLTEMIYQMRPGVGQHCWQVSLFKNSSLSEIPNEILTAEKEIESENLQKLCYEMDQMFIEQDFSFEAEAQDLILVGENDEDEMVTLEFIPESEEQKSPEIEERKLPEKPQIQSCITQFFKNNKK